MTGERTIRDVLYPDQCYPLGLDPDMILDRDCPTCEGCGHLARQRYHDGVPMVEHPCPDCKGTGREVVHVIVAVTPDDKRALQLMSGIAFDCETTVTQIMRELRIGRAVLASKVTDTGRVQMPPPDGVLVTSAEAYHNWLLAQGEA